MGAIVPWYNSEWSPRGAESTRIMESRPGLEVREEPGWSAHLFSDLIKRWQGAADPSDNQLACEERDIAMMRKIAAACLLVLLVAPLRGRTDDDFSCV